MAVSQSSSSSKFVIPPPPPSSDDERTESDREEVNAPPPPPAKKKRTKCPGVRIINNRVYDSEKGVACHQCRQKTMDAHAPCNPKKTDEDRDKKVCTIKYCYKCLLNRYGERVEEVNQLTDWQCPKCRNICNCSACRKKMGLPPTGCLAYKVRDNGMSSATEFLGVQGPQNVCMSPRKRKAKSKKALTKGGSSDDTEREHERDIPLPLGVEFTTVAGIDLSQEDAAHAIQFLEFCKSFEEVLNLKTGQAESIIQELTDQCSKVQGQHSIVVQFYIQLLSLMHKDMREGSTSNPTNNESWWLQALENFISESKRALLNLPSDCFSKDGAGYESLDPSQKLKLMNFLCDESLNTGDLRSKIEEDNSKLSDQRKEAKGKVAAAKEKEKFLKQKMDEVAKASKSENGDPSSISEHENSVSQMKAELLQAHAETLEAEDMVLKTKQRSDAVRTDPIFVDGNGWAFWRLKSCSSDSNILLQDIRICDSGTYEEKWFTYDKENIKEVERYISSVRKGKKSRKIQVVSDRHAPEQVTSETGMKNET